MWKPGIWLIACYLTACAQADEWDAVPMADSATITLQSQTGDSTTWKSGAVSVVQNTPIRLKASKPAGAASIRWFQIVPDTGRYYKNANHPWEPKAYQWTGFGKIDYTRRELESFRDQWEITLNPAQDFAGSSQSRFYQSELGSFWLQVEVLAGNTRQRSPGLAENNDKNLSPKVFRVSIRKDDGYVGHLTAFFNVPGLFGSIPYQSNNFIGADCADVLVAARRKWKGIEDSKDYNVAMLTSEWKKVATVQLAGGKPDRDLKWNTDFRPGDAIAVRYAPGKQFQHIGALYEDADGDGALSPEDYVLHAGPEALHWVTLGAGSFDGEVVILRP